MSNPSIGMMAESSLHKALKLHYAGKHGKVEIELGIYICDGRTKEGELIEVQCASLAPLKEKAEALTKKNKLKVIHPIILRKHIELYDTAGNLLHRRRSPRKGSAWDLFNALLHVPELPLLKNLTIELAIIESVEKRIDDGQGSWRRKGISVRDRVLCTWLDSLVLSNRKDYRQFAPFKKNEVFTSRNLAEKAGITMALAGKTLYVLTKMGLVRRTGRQGRAFTYVRT